MKVCPNGVLIGSRRVVRYHSIRFYRCCIGFGKFKTGADNMRSIFERLFPFSIGEDAMIGNIAPHIFMQNCTFRLNRCFDTYDCWQRIVLHMNEFCCILRNVTRVGYDDCYRLTNESYLVYRNRVILDGSCHSYRERSHLPPHISSSNDSHDSWNLQGCPHINLPYVGMCIGTSNDSGNFATGEGL